MRPGPGSGLGAGPRPGPGSGLGVGPGLGRASVDLVADHVENHLCCWSSQIASFSFFNSVLLEMMAKPTFKMVIVFTF